MVKGRPRDSRVDRALVDAVRDVLADGGYAKLTVDAVAARAGTGKAAIYRRYATKAEMIFAAVVHDLGIDPPPDSGSLRGDLAALLGDIATSVGNPAAKQVLPAMLVEIAADPEMGRRIAATFVARERACVAEVVDRAVRRGELTTRPDVEVVHAILVGPVFAWLLLLRRRDAGDLVDQLAAVTAAGLRAL